MLPKSYETIRHYIVKIIIYFNWGTNQEILESINNKLKLIKRRAYGFKILLFLNFNFFKISILLVNSTS